MVTKNEVGPEGDSTKMSFCMGLWRLNVICNLNV
jgi:hypothetical protein